MKLSAFNNVKVAALLLRLGLAIVLLYAAIGSFIQPDEWVGYLPGLITDHFDAKLILKFFSVYELILAVLLIAGMYVRYVALVVMLTLGGIVVSNFSLFQITFRDIALMFAAVGLALLPEDTPAEKIQ